MAKTAAPLGQLLFAPGTAQYIYNNQIAQPGPNYTDLPDGTVYIVAGTAGGEQQGGGQGPFAFTSQTGYNFALLNISNNVLTYTAKSAADGTIDTFTIAK